MVFDIYTPKRAKFPQTSIVEVSFPYIEVLIYLFFWIFELKDRWTQICNQSNVNRWGEFPIVAKFWIFFFEFLNLEDRWTQIESESDHSRGRSSRKRQSLRWVSHREVLNFFWIFEFLNVTKNLNQNQIIFMMNVGEEGTLCYHYYFIIIIHIYIYIDHQSILILIIVT